MQVLAVQTDRCTVRMHESGFKTHRFGEKSLFSARIALVKNPFFLHWSYLAVAPVCKLQRRQLQKDTIIWCRHFRNARILHIFHSIVLLFFHVFGVLLVLPGPVFTAWHRSPDKCVSIRTESFFRSYRQGYIELYSLYWILLSAQINRSFMVRFLQACSQTTIYSRCKTCKITDHFTCTSANVIYCITCTYCKKIYIGETGRRLGDRFREHLRNVERNDNSCEGRIKTSR